MNGGVEPPQPPVIPHWAVALVIIRSWVQILLGAKLHNNLGQAVHTYGSNDTGIGVLGIGRYLPVLGGIGIGLILLAVIVPNTWQTTVYSAVTRPTTI